MLAGLAGLTGCRGGEGAERRRSRVGVLVATKAIPAGLQLQAAVDAGAVRTEDVPGDLVRDDTLKSTDGARCLVAARAIPVGTVLTRSLFVEPATLGLEGGLDVSGSVVPCQS